MNMDQGAIANVIALTFIGENEHQVTHEYISDPSTELLASISTKKSRNISNIILSFHCYCCIKRK